MEPFQAEVQGIKVLQKAWHSWLTKKSGTREQEYIEYSAVAWIVSPWKLEQSLVLVSEWPWLHGNCWEELIPWIAGAGHTGKWGYFGLPSAGSTCCIQHPKQRNQVERNFVGLPQLPWSLSKIFPCFSNDCWTLCSQHIQLKTFGVIPVLSFFHEKSKHEFGSRNPGGCCVSYKSRAAFQWKPSVNQSHFCHFNTWPLPEVGTMEILECSQCVPGWICHILSSWLRCAACFFWFFYFCNVPLDA